MLPRPVADRPNQIRAPEIHLRIRPRWSKNGGNLYVPIQNFTVIRALASFVKCSNLNQSCFDPEPMLPGLPARKVQVPVISACVSARRLTPSIPGLVIKEQGG